MIMIVWEMLMYWLISQLYIGKLYMYGFSPTFCIINKSSQFITNATCKFLKLKGINL